MTVCCFMNEAEYMFQAVLQCEDQLTITGTLFKGSMNWQ